MPIGRYNLDCTAESIRVILLPSFSRQYAASLTKGMNILLTINPGTSLLHKIGYFDNDFTKFNPRSTIDLSVLAPGITSTNFINCGGLKKCNPMNLSGLLVN